MVCTIPSLVSRSSPLSAGHFAWCSVWHVRLTMPIRLFADWTTVLTAHKCTPQIRIPLLVYGWKPLYSSGNSLCFNRTSSRSCSGAAQVRARWYLWKVCAAASSGAAMVSVWGRMRFLPTSVSDTSHGLKAAIVFHSSQAGR